MARTWPLDAAKRHWFLLLLPLALLAAWNFRQLHDWGAAPAIGEAVVLFDWCVALPALHAACYWRRLGWRALALRTLGLMSAGLWIAGYLVPDPAEDLLADLAVLRAGAVWVIAAFELFLVFAVIRLAYRATPDLAAVERLGVPPVLARLMAAEARFWRRVWGWFTRR